MKSLFFLFCFLSISSAGISQIHFEAGYFINNSNEKTECLIKNKEWNLNPTEFSYKLSERSEVLTGTIQSIKEFGISNALKYIRVKVKIDESAVTERTDYMSRKKAPDFVEKEIFLKSLLEGEASLYEYRTNAIKKYFFKKNNGAIEQLLYKVYFNEETNIIRENNLYKHQLGSELKCKSIDFKDLGRIKYIRKKLLAFFKKYNKCAGSEINDFSEKHSKIKTNISLKLGLSQSSLTIYGDVLYVENVFIDEKINFRYGLETEFVLPFNRNKWGLFLEPTLQSYKVEQDAPSQKATVNYTSLEVPIGVRYYLFLTDRSKFFVNTAFTLDFEYDTSIVLGTSNSLRINTRPTLALGVGFKQSDLISLEFRYYVNRELIGDHPFRQSDYNVSSLVLGFTIPWKKR